MRQPQSRFDLPDDEPLDPAVERVRQKMQRVQIVSLSIMMLGFVAVLAAISYRIWFQPQEPTAAAQQAGGALLPSGETQEFAVELPAGARIVETHLDGPNVLVRLRTDEGEALWTIHQPTGDIVSKITFAR
ncbi:MAG: hypothetical protein AAGH82_07075 [Pseudomonadota bacterium]